MSKLVQALRCVKERWAGAVTGLGQRTIRVDPRDSIGLLLRGRRQGNLAFFGGKGQDELI